MTWWDDSYLFNVSYILWAFFTVSFGISYKTSSFSNIFSIAFSPNSFTMLVASASPTPLNKSLDKNSIKPSLSLGVSLSYSVTWNCYLGWNISSP